jgi:hypothetical protein
MTIDLGRRLTLSAAALALSLTACGPKASPNSGEPAVQLTKEAAKADAASNASGCSARASTIWKSGGGAFAIDAFADGPDCARAVATIVIRDSDGAPMWTDSRVAGQTMTLAQAKDVAGMHAALAEWVDSENATFKTTGDLPAWTANHSEPYLGEFAFYPEPGVGRGDYEELRGKKLPIFCYVQGMESLACVILRDGGFEKVGVQTFPG